MSSRGSQQVAVGNMLRLFEDGTLAGLSEGQLLDRFVSRSDSAAFEALVDRHGPMVWGVCKRVLADPNDVDDAFQATFLVLAKKAAGIRDQELLGNWLYGVAHRISVRARADAAKRRGREAMIESDPASKSESFEEVARRELAALIQDEVARLPEKYRLPVVLCDLAGHTHEEAARRLDCPVGTVKGRQSRARDMLKQRLVKRGFSAGAAMVALGSMNKSSAGVLPIPLVHLTTKAALFAVTGRAAALGLVSIHAVSLMQGAITAMSFSTIKIAAAGVLTAGFVVGGAFVFATDLKAFAPQAEPNDAPKTSIAGSNQPKDEPQARKQVASEPIKDPATKEEPKPTEAEALLLADVETADELEGLQSELIKQAKKSYQSSLGYLKEGRITPDRVYEASLKLLQAEGEENPQALTDHVQRMKDLQLLEVRSNAGGRGTITNLNAAMTYVLEAKLKLARFKTKAKPTEKSLPGAVEEGQAAGVVPMPAEQPKKRVSFEEAQRNLARHTFETTLAGFKRGDTPVSDVYQASQQWSIAELNLLGTGANYADQTRIRREHQERMINLAKIEDLSALEQNAIKSYVNEYSTQLHSMERTLPNPTEPNSGNPGPTMAMNPPSMPAGAMPGAPAAAGRGRMGIPPARSYASNLPDSSQPRPSIPGNSVSETPLQPLVLPPPSEGSEPPPRFAAASAVFPPMENSTSERPANLPPVMNSTEYQPLDDRSTAGQGPYLTPTPGQEAVMSASSIAAGTPAYEPGFDGRGGGGGLSPDINPEEDNPLTLATLEILKKSIEMNFKEETALDSVLTYLRSISEEKGEAGLIFYLDPIALQDADRTETSSVKINLEKVSIRTALRLLLTQLDLTYFVQDGIVIITNDEGIDRFRDVFNRSEVLPAGVPRKTKNSGGFKAEKGAAPEFRGVGSGR